MMSEASVSAASIVQRQKRMPHDSANYELKTNKILQTAHPPTHHKMMSQTSVSTPSFSDKISCHAAQKQHQREHLESAYFRQAESGPKFNGDIHV